MNRRLVLCSIPLIALAGCTSSPLVGTWTGRGAPDMPFSFGSVSFVGDNTFTAEARYNGNTRVQSGTWTTRAGELDLRSGETARHYTFKVDGNELIVTDPKSGKSLALDRLQQ